MLDTDFESCLLNMPAGEVQNEGALPKFNYGDG